MKKILAIIIATVIIGFLPTVNSTTTVTGTFTPVATGVSIACNNTAPTFGNINLGSSAENLSINVTNDGDTNCSVTMTAEDGPGTWALVAGTTSPATSNEFCINGDFDDAGYVDVQTEKTVASDLSPQGGGRYHVKIDLKVFVSDYTSEGSPSQQTFYANLTASAIS